MRLSSPSRRARRVAIALTVCLGSSLFATSLASADTRSETTPAPLASFALRKANLGLAPGTGFFLDAAHIRSGLNEFKTLGVHWIRSTIPWQNIQPYDPHHLPKGKPMYNWKGVDELAATLQRPEYKGRFSLIVTVEQAPDWASTRSNISHISCKQQAPFDLPSYARATAALAQHMKASAHVFEVENSPNIGTRSPAHKNPLAPWSPPNPCGYAQLMKLTTAAVHATHVGALVLVGGIGGTKDVPNQRIAADEFLQDLYHYGARGAFDGVSYHPYSTPRLPCAPSASICTFDPSHLSAKKHPYGMTNGWDRMLNARRIMVANHDSAKQMWITEFGGPTSASTMSRALTDQEQANLLTTGFERASQYPWVAEMCWFTYDDKGGDPRHDPTGNWMGLLRKNGTHKPSFAAYQHVSASAKVAT